MAVIKNNIIFDKENNLAADIYFPNDTSSETKILIFLAWWRLVSWR